MPLPKDIVTESIRYWEPRRLTYNLILIGTTLAVASGRFFVSDPDTYTPSPFPYPAVFIALPIFAVLANVAYCAAYMPDIFVQQSDFQEKWKSEFRPLLFWIGTIFAALLTAAITFTLFYPFLIKPPFPIFELG